MSGVRRVEWIGVRTPLDDAEVSYRKLMGKYTPDEEVLLEAVTKLVSPLVRQYLTTARAKGVDHGYERDYVWGPRWFVCEMTVKDAERLFREDPDEYEFRDLDYEGHDGRVPVVPWPYINGMLFRIMEEARNGPKVVQMGQRVMSQGVDMERALRQYQQDRIDQAREYGRILDPYTLKPVG